jgi:hypothetical protein
MLGSDAQHSSLAVTADNSHVQPHQPTPRIRSDQTTAGRRHKAPAPPSLFDLLRRYRASSDVIDASNAVSSCHGPDQKNVEIRQLAHQVDELRLEVAEYRAVLDEVRQEVEQVDAELEHLRSLQATDDSQRDSAYDSSTSDDASVLNTWTT